MSEVKPEAGRFNSLLNELDVRAQRGQIHAKDDCRRRRPRYTFRTPCSVRFLPPGATKLSEWPGRTRNLSRSGLALLVRRAFSLGDAVEIELKLANQATMFMAGIVTFCRYAGGGYHEVGVGLRLSGPDPIFSSNPAEMVRTLELIEERTAAKKRLEAAVPAEKDAPKPDPAACESNAAASPR